MHIKTHLKKHRFSPFLSWIWAFAGLAALGAVHRVHFAPIFMEQFNGDLSPIRPLYWGAIFCYLVVSWLMISERRLPYSNNFEVLVITSLLGTCALLLFLAAAREFYSGTYLFVLFCCQVIWLGMEVFFRNRFVTYRFGVFPTSLNLSPEHFPEHDVFHVAPTDEPSRHAVDAVVVDFNAPLDPERQSQLAKYRAAGVPILPLGMFLESVWGRISTAQTNEVMAFASAALRPYLLVKPVLDRLIALVGLLATAPIVVAAAAAVKMTSPGPALFRQERVGLNGRPFMILKLRTMLPGVEKLGAFAVAGDDKRLIRIGGFLRRFHIDELPQLLNVLKGDMAIVGPRPETSELTELYKREIPGYALRNQVLPGVTSWALIHQGNVSGIEDTQVKLSYDLFYLKHASCFLDFYIIVKTIWVMAFGIERLHSPDGLRVFGRNGK